MYRYFQPSSRLTATEAKPSQTEITDTLKKHHIGSPIENYENEKDLAEKLQKLPSSVNTVVMIGDEADFENLIGLNKLLSDDVAVGFLPLAPSRISHKMGLKSWNEAIEILAQRRISELRIFSIGSRFFFDQIELHIEPVETDFPITITTNQSLRVRVPKASLRFENVSSEQFRSKSPLQLQIFAANEAPQQSVALFTELRKRIKKETELPTSQKIGQVYGKSFSIESATALSDNLNRNYGSRVRVGQHQKTLRLITKRNTQL